MTIQKFKGYSELHGLTKGESLLHWMSEGYDLLLRYSTFIQFLGYLDASNVEVYEGDVLELKITEDLMNPEKCGFHNSNLGKAIKKLGNVTSVILVHPYKKNYMTMDYEVYFCLDGKIERDEDNNLSQSAYGTDANFPQYLVQYGAVVVGNLLENNNILADM